MTLCESGDHVVASPSLYGGTYNLLHYTLPKFGIEVTFVDDPDDLSQWEAAIKPNTKVLFGEVIPNPKNDVLDIEGIAGVAHANGIPLMVDNTVPTPYLIRPLEWGADIVIHSLTKFMGGHGTSVAGAIVDGGPSTTPHRAASRTPPSPIPATTASPTSRRSATAPSSSRPVCRCCATSAWRSRRSTRS